MKRSFKSVVSLVLMLAMVFSMVIGSGSLAFASSKDTEGELPESLTVNVKYKDETVTRVYKLDDIKKMNLQTARYSYIDSFPSVVIAEAKGVYITDILDDMKVEYNKSNLSKIVLLSVDEGSKNLKYDGLSGSYYPNLALGCTLEDGELTVSDAETALSEAESVDAMLALECDWRRVDCGKTFEDSQTEEANETYFRYMPVANEKTTKSANVTASNSLKWVYQMDVTIDANLNPDNDKPGKDDNNGGHNNSGNNNNGNNNNGNNNNNNNNGYKIPDIATVQGTLSDIAGHWAEKDIYRMVALGAVNGNPDGTFKPNGSVTRAEFVTMLMKSLVKCNQGVLEGSNGFADVKGHWAEKYIAAAVDAGIVKGTSETNFEPNKQITRQEMSVMIVNALKFENKEGAVSGVDTDKIAVWAKDAVDICNDYGLMTYDKENKFYPLNNATRAEAATVLWRAFSTKGYVTE